MTDSTRDRIEGTGDKIKGDVKQSAGRATDDKQLEGEGKLDEVKGDVKKGMADVKDKVSDMFNKDDK